MLANLPAKLEEEELDEIMNEADPKNGGTVDIAAFNKSVSKKWIFRAKRASSLQQECQKKWSTNCLKLVYNWVQIGPKCQQK